jgi:hypothetical protein
MTDDLLATQPRVVLDLPEAEYHALPALSASGCWALADINEGCPAKFWQISPWNPEREPFNAAHFDIGKAAHLAVLEPARVAEQVAVHGFDDYRTKEARDRRDAAYAAGRIPLKPAEWALVQAMRDAIQADPLARGAFTGEGESEVTLTWTDEAYGVPCKARADRVLDGGRILVDLKTAASAHPIGFGRATWDHGYFARAAWYLDGWEAATGRRPDEYWYIAVEKKEPHLVAVHKLPEKDIEWGRIINRQAVATFADCMARGEWPGYRPPGARAPRAFVTGLPTWATYQLHDAMEASATVAPKITAADVERGIKLYAPRGEIG